MSQMIFLHKINKKGLSSTIVTSQLENIQKHYGSVQGCGIVDMKCF